jgi:Helix-turn-helix domain
MAADARPYREHNMTAAFERQVYPVRQSKIAIGVCPAKAYKMARRGELKLVRIGGRTFIPKSEVERLTRVTDDAQRPAA